MPAPYTTFTTRPEIRGTFGAAATTHWIASGVAMGMLERGGNAFDAAVAAGFTLQLLEPHLCGPGGEAPIIFWSEREQTARVLCGQGVTPGALTLERIRGLGLQLVPGTGLLPACVPGQFDAWMLLLRDYGTMSLRDVLEPAIHYAKGGVPLVPRIAQAIRAVQKLFEDEWPGSAAIFLPGGRPPGVRDLLRNPSIGATYERVLATAEAAGGDRTRQIEVARNAWYRGFVAEAIDEYCRDTPVLDTTGERHTGLLTGEDMARWQASYDAPATVDVGRYRVAKCGFWSQGPVLLQSLGILAARGGLDRLDAGATQATGFVHAVTESLKLAMADRDTWYGDPQFADVPAATLLSPAYAAARGALIGESASLEHRPGAPDGRMRAFPDWRAAKADVKMDQYFFGLGEPTFAELPDDDEVDGSGVMAGDTVHLDIVDRWGNMVSATPSGGWLSSSPVIPALGFPLGTRGQMFWLEDGHPAVLGGRRRPRTTLSPSLAFRDGMPWAVFGTPGGDQQDQWQLTLFLRVAFAGMNWQEAIDAPSWHTKHSPTSFWPRQAAPGALSMEGRWPADVVQALEARGHKVTVGDAWSEGRLTAVSREDTRSGRVFKAAANPRGMQGYAVGR